MIADGDVDIISMEHLQRALEVLVSNMASALFASVSMIDGRAVAYVGGAAADGDPQRVAALASSLLGLIESFSHEALGAISRYSTIATDAGSIVIARIPCRSGMYIFCQCVDRSDPLALAIRSTLDGAGKLGAVLDADA